MIPGMGHLLGYARVSTVDQDPALQLDALTSAGCARVWVDRASGAMTERPELDALLPGSRLEARSSRPVTVAPADRRQRAG